MPAASIDACSIITRCLSLPKRNDKSVWKMHFSAPSQWHKIRFEYQGIIFNEKRPKIFTNAFSQARGREVTPPIWSAWPKKAVLVFDNFPKVWCQKKSSFKMWNILENAFFFTTYKSIKKCTQSLKNRIFCYFSQFYEGDF